MEGYENDYDSLDNAWEIMELWIVEVASVLHAVARRFYFVYCEASFDTCYIHGFQLLLHAVARRFYFVYCEASFDARYIHDFQLTFVKDAAAPAAADAVGVNGRDGQLLPAQAAVSSPLSAAEALSRAAERELPRDPITQASVRSWQPLWEVRSNKWC